MKRYLVAIVNTFDAEDGEHAIEQFVDLVSSCVALRDLVAGDQSSPTWDQVHEGIRAAVNDLEELEDES